MAKKINVKGPIVSNSTAEIYSYFGWDAASPNTIIKGLEEAAGDDVVIEINSPGGVCVYGYEMYTHIMEYKGKVTAHVISAMSAATLIVCAADKALISDTGIFMIHNVISAAEGDYRDMQMKADALKEFNAGIINAYARKTGKSREDIQSLMDKDCYMSPQTAIEMGFIDGYIFGNPNDKEKHVENFAASVVAAYIPIIPEDKAKKLIKLIRTEENLQIATSQLNEQKIGTTAVSDIKNLKGGKEKMNLAEILAEDPEAQAEFNEAIKTAKAEGKKEERDRIQSLDKISSTVTAQALNDAKYGENPIDGPTLAYQAMVNGDKLASAYMAEAIKDSRESGADDVKIGTPDAGQEQTDAADDMAAYINKSKGGN